MKKIIFSLVLAFSLPVFAEEPDVKPANEWLNRLSQALKTVNFTASFVVVKNNHAEPYHWLHGVTESGDELEVISLLNGHRRDIYRKNDQVSYIEPEYPPHSITQSRINGPIPAFIFERDEAFIENYHIVPMGKHRVLGRLAQLIRVEAKDKKRFSHWLWLDESSSLLLKLAVITDTGQVLEQIQFTHLDIGPSAPESLLKLQNSELPQVVELKGLNTVDDMSWRVDWLPTGFNKVQANRHKMVTTQQPVEFMLFNDGLVDVSVYISASNEKSRDVAFDMDGATTVLNQVVRGFEVSVVGKVSVQTAKDIADSVLLLPAK